MKTAQRPEKMTQAKLAALLGVSRQLIAVHLKKPDAPTLADVAGWTAYFAAHGRIGSQAGELRREIATERLAILRETKRRLERENDIESGKFMLVSDALEQASQACALFSSELDRRDRELPPALAGLSAIEIAQRMKSDTEAIRATLKQKFKEIGV